MNRVDPRRAPGPGPPPQPPASAPPPTLLRQLSLRLVAVVVGFVVLQVGITLALYSQDSEELGQDLVAMAAARLAAALSRGDDGRLVFAPDAGLAAAFGADQPRGFAIHDAAGTVAAAANPRLLEGAGLPEPGVRDRLVRRDDGAGGFVVVGTKRVDVEGRPAWIGVAIRGEGIAPFLPVMAREVTQHVWLPMAPLSVLLALFVVLVVRRMLAPLRLVAAEADRLDPGETWLRLTEAAMPREALALVRAVNRALARVERALAALREFTADAAHELRTPLAVLRLGIDRLPEGEARTRLRADADGMARLLGQMLALAHAEALTPEPEARADLLAVARDVVAQLAPLAIRDGRELRLADAGAATVRGDAGAIGQALRNLVDNALAHAPPGSAVVVTAGPGPELAVADRGPGFPPAARAQAPRRFWRADRRRPEGAGLGLGIVGKIMEAHRGRLEIGDAPEGGAVARLLFGAGERPAAPPTGRIEAADGTGR